MAAIAAKHVDAQLETDGEGADAAFHVVNKDISIVVVESVWSGASWKGRRVCQDLPVSIEPSG